MDGKWFGAMSGLMLALFGLTGCAPVGSVDGADRVSTFDVAAHEKRMRKQWADKPYRALVKHMGREGVVMDIPRYGWPASSAVVYGYNPASGCIDAFLVLHGDEPMIEAYFCR